MARVGAFMCLRFAVVFLGLVMMAVSSLGCSPLPGPYEAPTLEYKMMDSDIVVYGIPREVIPDTNFPAEIGVYSVVFEIRCIFKGAPLPERITISRVGTVPGFCISTNLTLDNPALVWLSHAPNDEYEPSYTQDPGNPQYMEEVVTICGVTINYPEGYGPDNYKEECPEEYSKEYDDCIPIPDPTTRPPPPEPEVTLHPDIDGPVRHPGKQSGDSVPGQEGGDGGNGGNGGNSGNGGEAPYEPVKDGNDNGSATLTLHLGTLLFLLVSTMAL